MQLVVQHVRQMEQINVFRVTVGIIEARIIVTRKEVVLQTILVQMVCAVKEMIQQIEHVNHGLKPAGMDLISIITARVTGITREHT